jgi:membrane protease YdiL (CAAX protease family)
MTYPKTACFLLPFFLLSSTMFVFAESTKFFGREAGYLIGFAFYWLFWCLGIPVLLMGISGFSELWQEKIKLFSQHNWPAALLFFIITAIAIGMYGGAFIHAPLTLALVAIPVAIINGVCEEFLWRGMYVRIFPDNVWMGILYPALGFSAWHLAPLQVFPAIVGTFPFVISTFFLGLAYGFIAYRTGSARWTTISHSLNGILALSGGLAPSLIAIFFS